MSYQNDKMPNITNITLNLYFPYIFHSQSEMSMYLSEIDYTSHDILFYTDESHNNNPDKLNHVNVAAIGTHIYLNFQHYNVSQLISNQSSLYAEQYALLILSEIISKYDITNYDGIIIFTDHVRTFFSIYRSNEISTCPILMNKIHYYINSKLLYTKLNHRIILTQSLSMILLIFWLNLLQKKIILLNLLLPHSFPGNIFSVPIETFVAMG